MSDGAKTGSKKPHYTQKMKDEIARLMRENEELRAAQSAPVMNVTINDTWTSDTMPETATSGEANVTITSMEPAPVVDPLAWITDKTPAVFFVSSTSTFFLTRGDKNGRPARRPIVIEATSDPRPWANNPFDFRNADRQLEQNNEVMMARWHHLMLRRDKAVMYWRDPETEEVTETVIDPKKFTGWNKLMKQPRGEMDPITEFVPLRELARKLLQKNDKVFLDWSQHRDKFDLRVPNPYHRRLVGVGSAVRQDLESWEGKVIDSRSVQ